MFKKLKYLQEMWGPNFLSKINSKFNPSTPLVESMKIRVVQTNWSVWPLNTLFLILVKYALCLLKHIIRIFCLKMLLFFEWCIIVFYFLTDHRSERVRIVYRWILAVLVCTHFYVLHTWQWTHWRSEWIFIFYRLD